VTYYLYWIHRLITREWNPGVPVFRASLGPHLVSWLVVWRNACLEHWLRHAARKCHRVAPTWSVTSKPPFYCQISVTVSKPFSFGWSLYATISLRLIQGTSEPPLLRPHAVIEKKYCQKCVSRQGRILVEMND
jgi:hypothetical protein